MRHRGWAVYDWRLINPNDQNGKGTPYLRYTVALFEEGYYSKGIVQKFKTRGPATRLANRLNTEEADPFSCPRGPHKEG